MPIGTSDGFSYPDEMEYVLAQTAPKDDLSNFKPEDKKTEFMSFPDFLGHVTGAKDIWNDIKTAVDTGGNDTDAVTRLAMSFGMGGLATAPARPGVGMFGGRMTRESVFTAERMESQGYSPQTIKEVIGVERGADGMWRKEFSDSSAKVDQSKLTNSDTGGTGFKVELLKNILDHPELYKAYPDLENLPILQQELNENVRGVYLPKGSVGNSRDQIAISSKLISDDEQFKKTLLHEIQHYIQEKEGFSLNPSENLPDKIKDQIKKDFLTSPSMGEYTQGVERLMNFGRIREAEELADFLVRRAEQEVYMRTAHEVEARNVVTRSSMSPEQIKNSLGRDTEDTVRSKQIYSKGSKNFIGSIYDK